LTTKPLVRFVIPLHRVLFTSKRYKCVTVNNTCIGLDRPLLVKFRNTKHLRSPAPRSLLQVHSVDCQLLTECTQVCCQKAACQLGLLNTAVGPGTHTYTLTQPTIIVVQLLLRPANGLFSAFSYQMVYSERYTNCSISQYCWF